MAEPPTVSTYLKGSATKGMKSPVEKLRVYAMVATSICFLIFHLQEGAYIVEKMKVR